MGWHNCFSTKGDPTIMLAHAVMHSCGMCHLTGCRDGRGTSPHRLARQSHNPATNVRPEGTAAGTAPALPPKQFHAVNVFSEQSTALHHIITQCAATARSMIGTRAILRSVPRVALRTHNRPAAGKRQPALPACMVPKQRSSYIEGRGSQSGCTPHNTIYSTVPNQLRAHTVTHYR
jgi:hypothetical protein